MEMLADISMFEDVCTDTAHVLNSTEDVEEVETATRSFINVLKKGKESILTECKKQEEMFAEERRGYKYLLDKVAGNMQSQKLAAEAAMKNADDSRLMEEFQRQIKEIDQKIQKAQKAANIFGGLLSKIKAV